MRLLELDDQFIVIEHVERFFVYKCPLPHRYNVNVCINEYIVTLQEFTDRDMAINFLSKLCDAVLDNTQFCIRISQL